MTSGSGSYQAVQGGAEAERLRAQAGLLWARELALLREHGLRPDGTVLDVGCGPGFVMRQLKAAGFTRLIGVDREAAHLKTAQGVAPLVRARAEALPMGDDSVDAVLMRLILRHVTQPGVVLREAVRVLKPGGQLLLVDGDDGGFLLDDAPASWALLHAALMDTVRRLGADPQLGRSLRRHLQEAGLTGVRVTPWVVHSQDVPTPALVELLLAPGARPVAPDFMAPGDVQRAWEELRAWAARPLAYGAVMAFVASGTKAGP